MKISKMCSSFIFCISAAATVYGNTEYQYLDSRTNVMSNSQAPRQIQNIDILDYRK